MNEQYCRVFGPLSEIKELKEILLNQLSDGIQLTEIEEVKPSPMQHRPLGMEPMTYFLVVFAGHLAASFVHDWINSRIRKFADQKNIVVQEETEKTKHDEP